MGDDLRLSAAGLEFGEKTYRGVVQQAKDVKYEFFVKTLRTLHAQFQLYENEKAQAVVFENWIRHWQEIFAELELWVRSLESLTQLKRLKKRLEAVRRANPSLWNQKELILDILRLVNEANGMIQAGLYPRIHTEIF